MPACRFLVRGRVQGVGYRYSVLREAEALGITGYARNRNDASVEVVGEGSAESLEALAGRLAEGPAFAAVQSVEREAITPRNDQGFHIR